VDASRKEDVSLDTYHSMSVQLDATRKELAASTLENKRLAKKIQKYESKYSKLSKSKKQAFDQLSDTFESEDLHPGPIGFIKL
jgi:hypothetical protein